MVVDGRYGDYCKYNISVNYLDEEYSNNICKLPLCQYLCYEKSRNTTDYITKDIVIEIFITSLFHTEAFGQVPKQEHFDKMYEKLSSCSDINTILVEPLTELCKELIKDKSVIHLNPAFGGKLDGVSSTIPSDADLVADDMLIDIKCTKKEHPYSEITQLMGYSSLMMLNDTYRTKINNKRNSINNNISKDTNK